MKAMWTDPDLDYLGLKNGGIYEVEESQEHPNGFIVVGTPGLWHYKTRFKVIEDSFTKDTNPKDAVAIKKIPFSTISAPVLAEVGIAMLEGARKYGRHNYRVAGIRFSVYYDASMRHLTAWWEGEDIDPESGLSHITKAIAGLTVLRDAMIQQKFTDDRPPATLSGWQKDLQPKVDELFTRYPEAKPAFTETEHGIKK